MLASYIMRRLERKSLESCLCDDAKQSLQAWRVRHASGEHLSRHRHAHAFAAVVLSGRYVEAGDTGRHALGPGDVLIHAPYEAHIDRVFSTGAEVLVIPLSKPWRRPVSGHIYDPDLLACLAEKNATLALVELEKHFTDAVGSPNDWPALLAEALLRESFICLRQWAQSQRLHYGSLSRGFRQEFAVTPARFRSLVRMHIALQLLGQNKSLADAATLSGFSDQSRMARVMRSELDATPSQLRCNLIA
jgi:AraC-like DNA-binding protein/quercetin dioxygenase-like cupin family protein